MGADIVQEVAVMGNHQYGAWIFDEEFLQPVAGVYVQVIRRLIEDQDIRLIQKALGEAQAILEVQKATAEGLKMIKDIQADSALIKLRSIEAFEKAADGQATKIIIPSDIQALAGLVTSVTEIAKGKETVKPVK